MSVDKLMQAFWRKFFRLYFRAHAFHKDLLYQSKRGHVREDFSVGCIPKFLKGLNSESYPSFAYKLSSYNTRNKTRLHSPGYSVSDVCGNHSFCVQNRKNHKIL